MPADDTRSVDNVPMRILGVVGGTGPESTIDYYRRFIDTWRERGPAGTYPRVIVDSVEGGEVVRLLGQGDFARVATIIAAAVDELTHAGAGAALLASNATHLAYEGIRAASTIPLINIVEVTGEAAQRRGLRRVGLIGTRFVMQSDLYPERFGPIGIDVITPQGPEQDEVHQIYMNELLPGVVRDASRERLVSLIDRMRDRDGIEAVVLGGTELALILTEPEYAGVAVLNTAQIHVEAGIDWLLEGTPPGR